MRTDYCGNIDSSYIGQEVTLCGWVNKRRDLGGVIFIDLRDREGIVQVVFDPDLPDVLSVANTLRSEFCVKLTGKVRARPEGQVNKDMRTGEIEILGTGLEVINKSDVLPLDWNQENSEEQRLRYRYLDLRRPVMSQRLQFRAKVTGAVRRFLEEEGFLDIETPILTKATPEGARDYLVPSRTHKGEFFALPQSPQLFKQLLMMSGMDRYYQIVKCFRDEDLRADRQPEFTQIDIEASFINEDEIMGMVQGMIKDIFAKELRVDLGDFPRMPFSEAMNKYGSDKPDLRIPMELVDVEEFLQDIDFKVFAAPAKDPKCRVAALKVPGGAELSRKQIDEYTKFVGIYGAKGLAWIKVNEIEQGVEGLQSSIVKFIGDDNTMKIMEKLDAKNGDIVFFGADKTKVVNEALGALRCKLGEDLNMYTKEWAALWVVDFPMFEENDDGSMTALHHPFTAPSCSPEELEKAPLEALSRAYDMVLNGCELGGGSIRIHDEAMQETVFRVLGISEEEQREKFGFLLDALKFGAPPHGGLAFGLDRLIMLLTGATSIREVIAFPKTQSAACVMTQAPGEVSNTQLRDLHIKLREKAKPAE